MNQTSTTPAAASQTRDYLGQDYIHHSRRAGSSTIARVECAPQLRSVQAEQERRTRYPHLVNCPACIAQFSPDEQRAASTEQTEPYDC